MVLTPEFDSAMENGLSPRRETRIDIVETKGELMMKNKVDQNLFDSAVALIEERFGKRSGEGAAAVYTESGRILTSTAPDTFNDGVSLCHEVGAYCEAYKLDEKIVASICVHQDKEGNNIVLTPCGVCQERLFLYGGNVGVGVPNTSSSAGWESKKLKDVQPYYWRNVFDESAES